MSSGLFFIVDAIKSSIIPVNKNRKYKKND